MKRKYLAGLLYALMNPVQVLCGFELGVQNWVVGIGLVVALMVIEGFAVVVWMDTQTAAIREGDREKGEK